MAITTVITGRMTADPTLRTVKVPDTDGTARETKVLDFYLACDDGYKRDQNGNKIGTEFFRVTAWGGAAEAIAKYGYKGRQMTVTGASHLRNFTSNGLSRFFMAIPNPWYFEFLGANGEGEKRVENDAPANAPETDVAGDPETPWDVA